MTKQRSGFTLIELLVVIGIIAILATVGIIALNPARQFAQARNTQRQTNIVAILNAIGQNMADNKGVFTCANGAIPTSTTRMATSTYNVGPCLVTTYLPTMPFDPSPNSGVAYYTSTGDYDSGYSIVKDASTSRVTVSAPSAELGQTISATR